MAGLPSGFLGPRVEVDAVGQRDAQRDIGVFQTEVAAASARCTNRGDIIIVGIRAYEQLHPVTRSPLLFRQGLFQLDFRHIEVKPIQLADAIESAAGQIGIPRSGLPDDRRVHKST